MNEKGLSIDYYPLYHRNYFFNIITHLDLEFDEVRKILDFILDEFQGEDLMEEQGASLEINTDRFIYNVKVYGYEVVVLSRKSL